jgi:hypothetical protein
MQYLRAAFETAERDGDYDLYFIATTARADPNFSVEFRLLDELLGAEYRPRRPSGEAAK